jgi:class 3 adenylate cyclase
METKSNLPILSSDEINKIDEFRKAKQTAVLAILFSDIENSTYATEKLGEQSYSKLRHIHDELFIRIMTHENSGKIIKEMGDSFLCVFSEPSTAVLRAIEFQNAIYSNRDNLTLSDFTLKVKIGIHIGQVALENNFALDIFGRHVNRASRIQSIANGGQILTSQSIWENAVGWLKSHERKNINWISYGKAKLKGIKESVDIYCFYSVESGKPSLPSTLKKKKQKSRAILFAGITLILVASFISWQKIKQMKQDALAGSQLQLKKSYYVQFDFSELQNQTDVSKNKLTIDTSSLQEILFSQLIAVFSPDSVITESDLAKQFSKTGTFYSRHQNMSSDDSNYFRDTLNFSGSLFVNVKRISSANHDSLQLHIRMDMYPNREGSSAAERTEWFSISNIETPFRNLIQDMMMSTSDKIWTIQGYVTNSNDSITYFRLTRDASLRVGASIKFMREYIDMEGLHQRLEDLKKRIAYFKNIPKDSSIVKQYLEEYKEIETDILKSHSRGRWSTNVGIDMRGKITELYDSTGKATWTLVGKFPNDKPRQGDIIYLAY